MDDNKYPPESDRRPHLSLERHLLVGPHVYQLTASGTGDDQLRLTVVGWNAAGEVVSEISGGISPADLAPVADALTSTLAGLATLRRLRLTADPTGDTGSAGVPGSASGGMSARAAVAVPMSASASIAVPAVVSGSAAVPAAVPVPGAAAVPAAVPVAAAAAVPVRRHRNQGARWSAEDDERLAARHRAGASRKELMAEFGRSRGGITARLEHLGLIPASAARSRSAVSPGDAAVPEGDAAASGRSGAVDEGVISEAA